MTPEAEWRAHKELRGLGTRYLGSRYVLTLLGVRSAALPEALDRRIVDWVWNNPAGIGYLGRGPAAPGSVSHFPLAGVAGNPVDIPKLARAGGRRSGLVMEPAQPGRGMGFRHEAQ